MSDQQSTGRGAWAEPGVEQVAPGVHRMPLPLPMDGLRAVNVYVLEVPHGLVLIDGGWAIPESRALFEKGIAELGYELGDIRRFLVTHMHRDHYTQASVIGREVGARVSLGLGDKATMDLMHQDARAEDPNLARLRSAGAESLYAGWRDLLPRRPRALDGYAMPDEWLGEDLTIDLGSCRLDAVSTPGHTQGHYVFADTHLGLLFAGDHVLSTITPSIGFEPAYVQQPLRDYLASLAKVRAMPDLTLLPAHGPVAASSHQRIDELVAHHEVRLRQSEEAVLGGASTAYDVARVLPWTRRERRFDELGVFDAVLASFETLAHLELLTLQGRVSRTDGETVLFGPPAT